MAKERVIIFDTTMRDGEQSPGASMTRDEKLRIARALERMKVDVIEAGFPAASNGDFEAVRAIAGVIRDSTVCGLCRANDRDIQRGIDALKEAKGPWRIHTFIATSPIHMEKKLRMTPQQVLEQAQLAVRYAKNACPDVEFSPEDGSRSEPDFLCRVLEAVIREGATTINIPDTVGYAVPQQFGEFIRQLREKIPNSDKAVWSVHCHNDLGMAVANSLAAVMIGGARQIECTINGLGERAGNTSLEEVVMAVKTRSDFFGLDCGIDTTHIVPTSRLVSQITGFAVQPNKAVVGANAFRQRMKELGVELEGEDAYNKAFQRFKDLADKKADIFDEDLLALVAQEAGRSSDEHWKLVTMNQASGMGERPHARVVLLQADLEVVSEAQGDGPVDATFKAIESIARSGADLLLYSVNAVTTGTESQGEVTVRLAKGGRIVNGVGADTDIVVASAKAYISALNKLESKIERLNPQHQP